MSALANYVPTTESASAPATTEIADALVSDPSDPVGPREPLAENRNLGLGKLSQPPKRFRRQFTSARPHISKPALRRLARRGGIKRISTEAFETARGCVHEMLTDVIRDAIALTENSRLKTVTLSAVLYALKRNNRTLLTGFGK